MKKNLEQSSRVKIGASVQHQNQLWFWLVVQYKMILWIDQTIHTVAKFHILSKNYCNIFGHENQTENCILGWLTFYRLGWVDFSWFTFWTTIEVLAQCVKGQGTAEMAALDSKLHKSLLDLPLGLSFCITILLWQMMSIVLQDLTQKASWRIQSIHCAQILFLDSVNGQK